MKFTHGFWELLDGVRASYGQGAYDVWASGDSVVAYVPTRRISGRGDTLNTAMLTVTASAVIRNVARVRIEHHQGGPDQRRFPLGSEPDAGTVTVDESGGVLSTGDLTVRVVKGETWRLEFEAAGRPLTASGHRSIAHVVRTDGTAYVHEQLELDVGELIYGLGERFGPLVKNGQSVDIWNIDSGTSSERAYKNVPFYVSSRGYGVLVNTPGLVSFEVGSEAVKRVQFSVEGESIEYLVIYGGTQKGVLERYTALAGRPAVVPPWSYGLWLTTSFTTSYDEATVTSFIDGMAQRDLPLSVFHFDTFWMREFNWCDFTWDPRAFPDPPGMLARLHERGLRVCVWINPYIAQRSPLFADGRRHGYLLRRADGSVWQTDVWQAGMALVDFTNPEAVRWYQDKLRALVSMGVDTFKTDFGERIPLDVVYFDGTDPRLMHNLYTQLYNQAVFRVLEEDRGTGEAVVFARSATVGGQTMPVHWGGDSTSTFGSMAETLRGGLSLAYGGFAFWSHDIGGFEGTPDPAVFKRWLAFGLLSSHSRLHGSGSYRVPWLFDDEAVEVARRFTTLKLSLLPYLYAAGLEASRTGTPVMRPMGLEFGDDPAVGYLDRQYMLGPDLLVAPVFRADGTVDVYLPAGTWTNFLTGETVDGPAWRREEHDVASVPLYLREGGVVPVGARDDTTDYDLLDGVTLVVSPAARPGVRHVPVADADRGVEVIFEVRTRDGDVIITGPSNVRWSARLARGAAAAVRATNGAVVLTPQV